MANGEWLTQLMAGLGGAFTGATQAKSRMAEEAEAERLRQERDLEKQRLANQRTLASNLFKGPMSEQGIMRYISETGDVSGGAAASRFLPEPTKTPSYTQRMVGPGRRVVMTDPMTGKSIYAMTPEGQPLIEPREAPQERPLTQTQRGAGLTFYNRYFNDPTLANNPQEKAARQSLLRELQTQFSRASKAELGYMMMGGMRGLPRGVQNEEDPFEDF